MGRLRSGEIVAGLGAAGLSVVMFLDWFGGRSAWETMTVGRVLLVLTIALALTLVVFTLRRRAVSMAISAPTLLLVLYRVGIDEPGRNGLVSIDAGAYAGLALLLATLAGAWRTIADERTQTPESLRQAERVLAVRGAPRPAPPRRDAGPDGPERGAS